MAGGPIESIVIAGRRFTTDGEDTALLKAFTPVPLKA